MSMHTLVQFCQLRELIFVEEISKGHEPAYTFLDHQGARSVYTEVEIFDVLSTAGTTK